MSFLNVEIKARCADAGFIRNYLVSQGAELRGTDHQRDTYFETRQGRLKLRQGNIENNLIYYERPDQAGPKPSSFRLLEIPDAEGLREVLTRSNGVKVVVEKKREIWFIGNVKFHLDEVPGLGSFVEIEASNKYAPLEAEELERQCQHYLGVFGINQEDLVDRSYSDMLLDRFSG